MAKPVFDVVVAGTGACGLSAARYLRLLDPSLKIALVGMHAPMGYTSSMSAECFRDHWPSGVMRNFMRRSIALLQQFADRSAAFKLHKHGYLYVSTAPDKAAAFEAEAAAAHGQRGVAFRRGGPAVGANNSLRGDGFHPASATVFDSAGAVQAAYPFLAPDVSAALLAHNAGWISAHTMGSALLDEMLSAPEEETGQRLRASSTARGPAPHVSQGSPGSPGPGRPGGFVQLVNGEVTGFDVSGAKVTAVRVTPASRGSGASSTGGATALACGAFVNAAGPGLNTVHIRMCDALDSSSAQPHRSSNEEPAAASRSSAPHSSSGRLPWAGVAGVAPHSATYRPSSPHALPIVPEVHAKVIFRDPLRAIPRSAPMVICNDAIELPWTPDERAYIRDSLPPAVADRLLTPLPAGAHFRPYGGLDSDVVLLIWERWHEGVHALGEPPDPSVDGRLDHEWYPEVCLRGLSRVVPGLRAYFDERHPAAAAAAPGSGHGTSGAATSRKKAVVDGGYYTRTRENLPLIGPAPAPHAATHASGCVPNAFLCGAVSGFGIMGCHAAGELAALHVLGRLPPAALQIGADHLQRCDAYADMHAARCGAGGTSDISATALAADTFAGSRAAGLTLADDSASAAGGGIAASVAGVAASTATRAIASARGVPRAETELVQSGDVAAVSAGLYPALMSPLRYQSCRYMQAGGVRDQLLAAGGGQL